MANLKVLCSKDFAKGSKKIHVNNLAAPDNGGKRHAVQTRTGGRQSLLLSVTTSNRSGFGSETTLHGLLGKNPVPYVPEDIALGPRGRLLEMPAGPGPCKSTFTKFELLTAKEAKAAMQMLKEQD